MLTGRFRLRNRSRRRSRRWFELQSDKISDIQLDIPLERTLGADYLVGVKALGRLCWLNEVHSYEKLDCGTV
jgi:hypothetical protein